MNARPRLLIVDDEPANIQLLYQIFRDGYEIFMATSGEAALAKCRETPAPDLVLLDVVMPGIGGHEVCRQLKTNSATADIPVIFVTTQMAPDDETFALDIGGVDFITKPVNPSVVKARVRTHLTLKAQSDMLRSLAFVDGLMGVANRRRFDQALQTEWRSCRRNGKPLSLIMLDIDQFKAYNDHYGHQAGDGCLKAVAAAIQLQIYRPHDIVARYGGEEFACLLPECDPGAALAKAGELRRVVEELGIPHPASAVAEVVTVSVGVATLYPDEETPAELLISAADAALYQAKETGRNRVCFQ